MNMRVNYKKHEIAVTKELCMAGYPLIYFSVMCNLDTYFLEDSFSDSSDTVGDYIKHMVIRIENELMDGHRCGTYID
jgi:hypothetical protein